MKFEDLGLRIAKVRESQNISAYELSLCIGKDQSYMNKLENGKINPSFKTLLQICDALEITIDKIIY